MFRIRDAQRSDLEQIHQVARHLNTVNLPDDREVIEELIVMSEQSFSGAIDPFDREYLFVLEDPEAGRIVGTSMIHAQHGKRGAAHVYFDVSSQEHYSETIDTYLVHQVLRIGYNYDGPTEIGGLILVPEMRGHPQSLGKLLSYVRFLYIGMHRDRFRDELLSELLPPLEPDGTSVLWEHMGRSFTGLGYLEADKLSSHNKEFIQSLFPQTAIYTCLLPQKVQDVIGVVGDKTKGVEKMLRRIGFEYAGRIDPFDGGPHFSAVTDEVTLVAGTGQLEVKGVDPTSGVPAIVARTGDKAPFFQAVNARVEIAGGGVALPEEARRSLAVRAGDVVGCVLLP